MWYVYYIKKSGNKKQKKMTDKESFIHDKMYELQAKKIIQLDYVRELSYKFLPVY